MKVSDVFQNKLGLEFEVAEIKNTKDIWVRFLESGVFVHTQKVHILTGAVRDPYTKSLFGVGYIGEPDKTIVKDLYYLAYFRWSGVITRCYSPKFKKKNSAYDDCSVCEDWHNFSKFLDWFAENYVEGWDIDKDILSDKGHKVYSPDTCVFVPVVINSIFRSRKKNSSNLPHGVSKRNKTYRVRVFMGGDRKSFEGKFSTAEEAFEVYKTEKEKEVRGIANEYKDLIDVRVYNRMMNWSLEEYYGLR